ncbi:MAG: AbrB family transcriptional regulator [Paracoccaceae bacterium]|jgi:membrane AbrB-like protein|nr:AbrB family transcriptional regulator [Paracoccaceae bacterium]
MTPRARDPAGFAVACAGAAAGGGAAHALGFPAPFLTGSATAVTLLALGGAPLHIPGLVRQAAFLVLGIGIGTGVTPEVVSSLAEWPLSLAVLTASLAASLLAGSLLMERMGFDPLSAVLAATPGHLSYVIGYATERGLDVPRIAVVQAMRVLLLTLLVPPLLVLWGEPGDAAVAALPPMSPLSLATLAGLGAAAGLALLRLRIPAALLLAGMCVSAVGHATGLTPGVLPPWLALSAFALLGTLVGIRFRGVPLRIVQRALAAGLAVTALTCGIAVAAMALAVALTGLAPTLLLVAYAPGGVEAMAAMAVQLGLAPAFVAAHHVARLLVLTVLVPAFLARRGRS